MTHSITVRKDDRILKVDPSDLPAYLEQGFSVVPVVPKPAAAAPSAAPRRTERVVTVRRGERTLLVAVSQAEEFLADGYEIVEPEPAAAADPAGAPRRRRRKVEDGDESLLGSTIQPAAFVLEDGQVVQLGDVVAEAHRRSGLTVAQWNALPAEELEALIAEVVAELPLAAAPDDQVETAAPSGAPADETVAAEGDQPADAPEDAPQDAQEATGEPSADATPEKPARRRTRG